MAASFSRVGALGPCIAAIGLASVGGTCGPRPICVDQGSFQKDYMRVARGEYVMGEPPTPIFPTDQTLQTDILLLNASSLLESTPQKRGFSVTRRASTRSTNSSLVRREMHVPADNASGTWQLSLIILIDPFAR
jgi:hypothetical protein